MNLVRSARFRSGLWEHAWLTRSESRAPTACGNRKCASHSGLLNQFTKLRKQRGRIVRSRGSFRMILDTKDGEFPVSESFIRPVVEIHVRNLDLRWVE